MYSKFQQKYIDSVDGAAHQSAVEIIGQLENAIRNCIDYANNRETEWGSRAEASFKFLYDVLDT